MEDRSEVERIIEQVELEGYCCDPEFKEEISGLIHLPLTLYGQMFVDDLGDLPKAEFEQVAEHQNGWDEFFRYDVYGYEHEESVWQVPPKEEWIRCEDESSFFTEKATLEIRVYFRPQRCPAEGSTFVGLRGEEVDRYRIKEGKIQQRLGKGGVFSEENDQWEEVGPIDKWDEYNLFMIPMGEEGEPFTLERFKEES